MNSKKLGMLAAAAVLSVAAAQGFANEAKVKDGVCANACKGKHGNTADCGGKVQIKDAKNEEACKKMADAKWMSKADFAKSSAPAPAAPAK